MKNNNTQLEHSQVSAAWSNPWHSENGINQLRARFISYAGVFAGFSLKHACYAK